MKIIISVFTVILSLMITSPAARGVSLSRETYDKAQGIISSHGGEINAAAIEELKALGLCEEEIGSLISIVNADTGRGDSGIALAALGILLFLTALGVARAVLRYKKATSSS